MALETGTYISDLVSTNPVGTDTLDKADDHLRLLKSTIKATFPSITGPVTLTQAQLNAAARTDVSNTFTGNQTLVGSLLCNNGDSTNNYSISNAGASGAANAVLIFNQGGLGERMRIDAFGNVGIGGTPSVNLDLKASGVVSRIESTTGTNTAQFQVKNTGGTFYYGLDSSTGANFGAAYGGVVWHSGAYPILIATNNTERMRIDSNGWVGVGASPDGNARLSVVEQSSASRRAADFYLAVASSTTTPAARFIKYDNDTTTSNKFIEFTINQNGLGSGQINANGTSQAAFGTFSDFRLKENIVDLPSQLDKLMALRPVEFDYKAGGHQIGFIAQELQEVYPDAVGQDGEYLTLTGYGRTEARLIKALQEAVNKIEALEARVAALEAPL